jgi:hypothetical protein
MASDAQETLYRLFAALSGTPGASGTGLVTGAIPAATASGSTESGGAAKVALNVLKSGLGTVPLVSALFGLFGGDDEEQPAPLVKYALPIARDFQASVSGAGFGDLDYDQTGLPRSFMPAARSGEAATGATAAATAPQIQVNVQAMDARSFLDRSNEIAAAVREAMLNLNPINDVVTDL